MPPPPAIPVNVGAIVQNVGTAYAVYQAVMKHKPLLERYTTVTGKLVKNPGNFLVRIGTPFRQLIDACGGLPDGDNKVLAGGPMMGKAVGSLDVPVCKGTNSVTVLSRQRCTPQGGTELYPLRQMCAGMPHGTGALPPRYPRSQQTL